MNDNKEKMEWGNGKLWKSYKNNLMKNGKRLLSLTNLYSEQVLQVVLERNILKICSCLK